MVIVLKKGIPEQEKNNLKDFLARNHFRVNEITGEEDTILGAVGKLSIDPREVEILPGVERVIPISKPYKMASREYKKENTVVEVKNCHGQIVRIGGQKVSVIAGPCAVESLDQMMAVAERVAAAGAVMLRGGAFKPRTSPYAFQGLGEEGVKILRQAGDAFGLPISTEIVSAEHIPIMRDYVDVLQIGARNMQNFELLKKVGALGKPVILKRGLSATIEEWLMAAEYLLASGTDNVILCERGIRTYEKATRNTLDLSAIPVVRSLTHLPVIVDPSHGVGIRDKVPPMGLAAVVAGADGIIVEVHCNPEKALSDGAQTLYPEQFEKLMRDIDVLAPVVGKEVARIKKSSPQSVHRHSHESAEGKVVCAFSGDHGAYAEQAINKYFDGAQSLSVSSFRDVFQAVVNGDADYGMIPLENSLAGSVYENYDNLLRFDDVEICGAYTLRIEHSLLAPRGATVDTIKYVYSHPHGFPQCKEFLEKYHLQGYIAATINLGLEYNGELVGVMTFGKPRFIVGFDYEVLRLAFKNGAVVVGGAEKLFSYFIEKTKANTVISYVDISKFTGEVYNRLGFEISKREPITQPNYVWIKPGGTRPSVLSRYKTTKEKLVQAGLDRFGNTEDEIMENLGYYKLYNCGNIRYEWRKQNVNA